MVHVRLNEVESNPNPHINFITALPAESTSHIEAKELLRALAAQVKPIMKAHGLVVNSYEEYEYNTVFAGRNWNNGETVEIVLRRPDGSFLPPSWLMSTLCHELAHIKHMNHGPGFQALWSRLRTEVRVLQSKGYFGDGFWSAGTRLVDASQVGGIGLDPGELPEYMCGGAQTRARPARRRRRKAGGVQPSNRTGAQTAKRRKAGARVKIDAGDGHALNEDVEDEDARKRGTGFRKQATSKRAREERAAAIEKRLRALQGTGNGEASTSELKPGHNVDAEDSATEDEDEMEVVPETDLERCQAMLSSSASGDAERDTLRSTTLLDFWSDDRDSKPSGSTHRDRTPSPSSRTGRGRIKKNELIDLSTGDMESGSKGKGRGKGRTMVENEIALRKAEDLGMTGSGRKLGGGKSRLRKEKEPSGPDGWECAVCTLQNQEGHLACGACATPRGETAWSG